MAESLLRLQGVMDRTGFKRSKLYALAAAGRFPKPIKIEGCSVWRASEVDAWITAALAEASRSN